ncbi:MAG: metalloregulator ArsR/SmtB family transcription factor [Planctomycetaceae bacterium]|nr:metalloregulator ArsR/SmtB family transcription factor [Planctomycetaceae bacterium]
MRDALSLTFAALADPTRRALLQRLADGKANVTELAEPFLGQMTLPAVTKHLKVLEQAGLVTKTQVGRSRPCELNAEQLQSAAGWIDQYREFWEQSFDRLDAYLKTVTTSKPHPPQSTDDVQP